MSDPGADSGPRKEATPPGAVRTGEAVTGEGPVADSPRLPALCRGLVVIDTPSGVVIEGGLHRILLEGAAAKAFVPRLLPLLDGEHRMDEVCAKLPAPPARVRQAVRLLDDWGVLEDGRGYGDLPEESAVFYSRQVSTTAGYGGTGGLLHELASARVLLVADGDEELRARLSADLIASGVGAVREAGAPAGDSLVVALDSPERPEALDSAVRAAHAEGAPVLRIAFARDAVEAGPLFRPAADTSCVPCFRRDHDGAMVLDSGAAGTRGLLTGLATTEVLAVLARTTEVASLDTLVRTSLTDLSTERHLFVHDGCGAAPGEAPRLLDGYERYQALPPPGLRAAPRVLPPERQALQAAVRNRPPRMSVPARELPPEPELPTVSGGWPAGEAAEGTAFVEPAKLAGLLTWSAGFRLAGTDRPGRRRGAPSGGNLGSVELYVVTEADPFGLPGTVFAYEDVGHRMLSVRADAVPLKRVLDSTGLDAADMGAAIVVVATIGRLQPRYGHFSWRLTHLDAGFMAMQLAAAAQGYGMRLSFAASWAGDLPGLLELDTATECVAAVAGLAGTVRGEGA